MTLLTVADTLDGAHGTLFLHLLTCFHHGSRKEECHYFLYFYLGWGGEEARKCLYILVFSYLVLNKLDTLSYHDFLFCEKFLSRESRTHILRMKRNSLVCCRIRNAIIQL